MSNALQQRVAVFDLDGTLINGDSTIEFVNYFLRQQKSKKNYIKFLINRFVNYFIPLPGIRNAYRYKCIKLLTGYRLEAITLVANEFAKIYLSKIVNSNILKEANELKNDGFKTFILSGSIDTVVDAFVNQYGFAQSVGSPLAFDAHNICLGIFEHDILNSKINIIQSLSDKIDFSNSYGFSDNQTDAIWLKKFGHAYGVVSSYVDGDFWRKSDLEVLYKIPALKIPQRCLYWPLGYYVYTRLTTIDYIFGIIIDFVALPIILVSNQGFNQHHFYLFAILISFLIFYSAYEIGYITNDQHAYKEQKPTYRVPQWSNLFTKKLIFIRIVYSLISLGAIMAMGYNSIIAIVCLGILGGVYYLHNHVAGRLRLKLLSEFLLRILRIIGPIMPFINHNNVHDIGFMIVYIILSRSIFWLLAAHTHKSGIDTRNTLNYSLIIAIMEMLLSIMCFMIFKRIGLINKTDIMIYLFILLDLLAYPALTTLQYTYKKYKNYREHKDLQA